MRMKRAICLILSIMMVLSVFAGCQAEPSVSTDPPESSAPVQTQYPTMPETPAETTEEITSPQTSATVLSAEKDAELRADLQARIDEILNTETEIIHSDTYIPGETYTGTAYYVSNDGDDSNDGLTPETAWRTLTKVMELNGYFGERETMFQPGDAVFFRRGDIFRLSELGEFAPLDIRMDGITYSAYGEGEKPIITASSENGTGAEKWQLVYEDDTGKNGGNHQTFHAAFCNDACNDGGKGCGGTGNLYMAAAQQGNDKACHDGGVYTLLGADAGGQSQCDGEGQGDDGYDDTGDEVADKVVFAVALQGVEDNRSDFVVHFFFSPKAFLYKY